MYSRVPTSAPSIVRLVGDALIDCGDLRLHAGYSEVQQLHAFPGDQDVGRLEVSMDDPLPVRSGQGVGNLHPEFDRLPHLHRAGEGLALDVLHHQILGLAILSDVMERADVRMIQSRDRTRLTVETVGELGLEDLDRDGAVQSCVAGAVDVAHPARPDEGGQFVRAKASAWRPHRCKYTSAAVH